MTETEKLQLLDKKGLIDSMFIKDGWITVYSNNNEENTDNFLYPCLVYSSHIDKYKENREWGIRPGQEGKPSITTYYDNDVEQTMYETYSDEGIEPFIFSKSFNYDGGYERYVDISEEFILYFKLYERLENKQNRTYYYIDDSGELNEVIIISPNLVKIKLKYLKEYLSVRRCYLSVCFEFMRFSESSLSELGLHAIDQDKLEGNKIYNIYIEPFVFKDGYKSRNWTMGKIIIEPNDGFPDNLHFQCEKEYETFITGYDDQGNELLEDCSKTDGKYFTLTYFKKEVLDKYYNDPFKYQVTGMELISGFYRLKMDNNHDDYVAVFLIELRMLPIKEQIHWKQYNIFPLNRGMSNTYHETMIEGNWAKHPETVDLYFKYKYDQFNKKWESKFGWRLYKQLSDTDAYRLAALHVPTGNNVKSFCEQMLSLVIISIDSLNEAEFKKHISAEPEDKGITKFEKYLKVNGVDLPDMFEFLRHLQNLRSGFVAHRFSDSNTKVEKAIAYFNIRNDNYTAVAKEIFTKSIYSLNSLEKRLLI